MFVDVPGYSGPESMNVPDDWSFIKLGTETEYNKNPISIVGRVRLQLRNDYKNFWCAALKNGKHIWLMESFASFCILGSTWNVYRDDNKQLIETDTFMLNEQLNVKKEYVEKCEGITFEGEVGSWKLFRDGFFFMQYSNRTNNTAVFFAGTGYNIQYLTGGKITYEQLDLKNIQTWDEWK